MSGHKSFGMTPTMNDALYIRLPNSRTFMTLSATQAVVQAVL